MDDLRKNNRKKKDQKIAFGTLENQFVGSAIIELKLKAKTNTLIKTIRESLRGVFGILCRALRREQRAASAPQNASSGRSILIQSKLR